MKTLRLKLPGSIGLVLLILVQLWCSQPANAQSQVSGVVKDETGGGLPGVTVKVKGTNAITLTDANGAFRIGAAKTDILQFSYIGYRASEMPVGDKTVINVTLQPESKNLDEVVVTGYSKQSKHDVTGAASTISASVIQNTPITSVEEAIRGRVAGQCNR